MNMLFDHFLGFFTHVGCEWKRPTAIAFHYYVHTHVHGEYFE